MWDIEQILKVPLADSLPEDRYVWHYSMSGLFTVKSLFIGDGVA